jgi:hypothetical protein
MSRLPSSERMDRFSDGAGVGRTSIPRQGGSEKEAGIVEAPSELNRSANYARQPLETNEPIIRRAVDVDERFFVFPPANSETRRVVIIFEPEVR